MAKDWYCQCGKAFSSSQARSDHGLGKRSKKGPCPQYLPYTGKNQNITINNSNITNNNTTNNDNSINNDNSTNTNNEINQNFIQNVIIVDDPAWYPNFDTSHCDENVLRNSIMMNQDLSEILQMLFENPNNWIIKNHNDKKYLVWGTEKYDSMPYWYPEDKTSVNREVKRALLELCESAVDGTNGGWYRMTALERQPPVKEERYDQLFKKLVDSRSPFIKLTKEFYRSEFESSIPSNVTERRKNFCQ